MNVHFACLPRVAKLRGAGARSTARVMRVVGVWRHNERADRAVCRIDVSLMNALFGRRPRVAELRGACTRSRMLMIVI